MPRSSISSAQLGRRFNMTGARAVEILKKAGIKPIREYSTPAGKHRIDWPVNVSKRALREFRESRPRHSKPGYQAPAFKTAHRVRGKQLELQPKATVRAAKAPAKPATPLTMVVHDPNGKVRAEALMQIAAVAQSMNNQLAALTKLVTTLER